MIFSIKPKWANMIAQGSKTYELRRRPPPQSAIGNVAFVYATAPSSQITCACRVDGILKDNKEELWHQVGDLTGCTKLEYDEYFRDKDVAYAVELKLLYVPIQNLHRQELKQKFGFTIPQSWRWADELKELIG
ncbi:ASCH domain-containing protein [Rhizobium leguminosarum]|uniref:ASCH domain-containing protein n=1 Tax=Rhizobium leguminosarum TaxID=384 RepID=UPI00247AC4C0|nr:ASCH domain-containing protein [Rhizobium leguminosarum]